MREFLPQLTLNASVKENSAGGETLSFIIPMGPLQIICIANIPGDGEREAPAYVKFKLDTRDTQNYLNNRQATRPRRFNNDNRSPRNNEPPPHRGRRYDKHDRDSDDGDYKDYPQD